jgi:hypothetical protein
MAKGSGNTVYVVGLIFSILVSLSLVFVSYNLNEDVQKQKQAAADAQSRYDQEVKRVQVLNQELQEIRKLVTGREFDEISYDHFKATLLDPANKKLEEITGAEWAVSSAIEDLDDANIKDGWRKVSESFRAKRDGYTNLNDLFSEVYDVLAVFSQVIPRLRIERFLAKQEVSGVREDKAAATARLDNELSQMREQRNRIQDEAIDKERNYDSVKRQLQEKVENLQNELGRLERDRRLEEARLISQVSERDARIDDLTKKERRTFAQNSRPDGEVVFADGGLGYAWINLGRRHGLRPNTVFQVYQFVKGGRQKMKGVLEVRRVEEDMAQCAVVENAKIRHPITGESVIVPDPNDPVVKGDLIRTPLFDPHEQKTFVFLGATAKNRFYNREELEQKLEEFGARVDREVTIESDFVILLGGGEEDTERQEQINTAARFGVTFMVERELLEYLGAVR